MSKSEKNKNKSGEKKDKKKAPTRTPSRKYKDSPAGHFEDKLGSHIKALNKIGTKLFGWPGVEAINLDNLKLVKAQLGTLVAKGFTPARKKGGGRGINITPGMRVYLKKDAINDLKAAFPTIDKMELFVGIGCDPTLKNIPIRSGSGDLMSPWVSLVQRNQLSPIPVVEEASE